MRTFPSQDEGRLEDALRTLQEGLVRGATPVCDILEARPGPREGARSLLARDGSSRP